MGIAAILTQDAIMRRLCVFCGSSTGRRAVYSDSARRLGAALVSRGWGLVYGAGDIGLMGVLADAALQAGGEVIGVIPQALVDREVAHPGLTQQHIVSTMHERKALMADLADAFVALPGGYGTCDEFFEVLTWAQLGMHAKPIGLLNTAGYFNSLLAWLDHMVNEGFVRPDHRQLLLTADEPLKLLDLLQSYRPATVPTKWINADDL
jgi:uncharacterized protein (TIGR00730 family)